MKISRKDAESAKLGKLLGFAFFASLRETSILLRVLSVLSASLEP
jgi:hypothetical protein